MPELVGRQPLARNGVPPRTAVEQMANAPDIVLYEAPPAGFRGGLRTWAGSRPHWAASPLGNVLAFLFCQPGNYRLWPVPLPFTPAQTVRWAAEQMSCHEGYSAGISGGSMWHPKRGAHSQRRATSQPTGNRTQFLRFDQVDGNITRLWANYTMVGGRAQFDALQVDGVILKTLPTTYKTATYYAARTTPGEGQGFS